MKKTRGVVAILAGCAMFALSAVQAQAAERPGFETYVVRPGDTLSAIAGRVFGDVKRWREILKENPQVTNANRIYPGDTLYVPVPETAAPAGGTGGELEARTSADAGTGGAVIAPATGATDDRGTQAGAPATIVVPELPVEKVAPTVVVNPALYRSAGYIADNLPALAIVASQDDRILLGTADAAIVNSPVSPGRRFTVVRADRRIFHPRTGAYLGWLTRILGTAEVSCRGEFTSTVVLRGMRDTASVGDYLVPIDPDDVLKENALAMKTKPECIPAGAIDGVIVAFDDERLGQGELDIAYIDQGTSSGVAPGRRFTIYREIAPEGCVPVGELQVLRAGERTATALITTSFQEVEVGNLLRSR